MTEREQQSIAGGSMFKDDYARKTLVAVGIDAYQHTDRLRHAVGDARAVVRMFGTFGFETRELYDEQATKTEIMRLLEKTVNDAEPDDLVVFFFAGHGIDMKGGDGSVKGFLVPVEGRTREAGDLVPMDWLQIDLLADARVRAKHLLFLLDACSSGIVAARSSVSVDSSVRNYISELMKRQARQVITAGTGSQQVLDGGYQGHSIFAGLVLQGLEKNQADLNNDYYVTATELGLFLSERVHIESKGAQKPDFAKLIGTQGGEVVLRFPNERERQIIEERKKDAVLSEADLVLNIRPCAADLLVHDQQSRLVRQEKKVSGRIVLKKMPAGDYEITVNSRDEKYESVKMLIGVYGPTARDVTLPRRMHSLASVPLL